MLDMNSDELPFIPAAERNKRPILDALHSVLRTEHTILELGSGTGQHAEHFARAMPGRCWQMSELAPQLPDLERRREIAALSNLPAPIELDAARTWPDLHCDAIYTSNLLHFMPEDALAPLFRNVADALAMGAAMFVYGPFNLGGKYTSPGNRALDAWLQGIDTRLGLRDLSNVERVAAAHGLNLQENFVLPANNHLLVLRRVGGPADHVSQDDNQE